MNFYFIFLMFSGPETPKRVIGNRFIRISKKQFVSLTTQPNLRIQYGSKYSTHLLSFLPSRSDNTIDPLHPISPRSNATPSFLSLWPSHIPTHSLVSHLLSSAPRLHHFPLVFLFSCNRWRYRHWLVGRHETEETLAQEGFCSLRRPK